jgi:hypothetical protein
VSSHAHQVGAPQVTVDDVVANRLGEQTQRGDRRAQIVGDRRDQVAAGGIRLVARQLLAAELVDHRVGCRRQLRELVAPLGGDPRLALAARHCRQAVADRADVAQDPVGDQPSGEAGQQAGADDDRGDEHRLVIGQDHQQRDDDERDEHRRHANRHDEDELPRERSGGEAQAGGQPVHGANR